MTLLAALRGEGVLGWIARAGTLTAYATTMERQLVHPLCLTLPTTMLEPATPALHVIGTVRAPSGIVSQAEAVA